MDTPPLEPSEHDPGDHAMPAHEHQAAPGSPLYACELLLRWRAFNPQDHLTLTDVENAALVAVRNAGRPIDEVLWGERLRALSTGVPLVTGGP